jgi:gluconokinase
MVIVLMGPAGAGKSTIGRALARTLGWAIVDADDLHSAGSLEKLRRSQPLTDDDRQGWLGRVRDAIVRAADRRESLVVACSALKRRHREILRAGLRGVRLVYLRADELVLRRRLETRPPHVAGPALLASQLADLEEPTDDALIVDGTQPPVAIIAIIRRELGV